MPMRMTASLLLAVTLSVLATEAAGDTEGTPQIYVQSSTTDGTAYQGDRYAKCLPGDERGSKGRTLVYKVKPGADELEDTYDWYSGEVYLAGTNKGTLVVRVSSGFRGHAPRKEDLAVGLYRKGKLLKEYSALDLAKGRDNVRTSVSHYQWCRRVKGFCWLTSPRANVLKFGFALETVDGRLLCFDAWTGDLLDGWEPEKHDARG